MAESHDPIALRDDRLHIETLRFLVVRHGTEERGYAVTSPTGTRKWDLGNVGDHPFDVISEGAQEALYCCRR